MDYLAFLQKEIHAAAFATLAKDGRPEVRIIDVMLYDGKSLYFLTAKGKEFYRQLIQQRFVAVTGEKGRRAVSLRGHVRVADPALLDVMFEQNPYMNDIYPGDTRRALEACGVGAFSLEDEGLSLAFHPRHISIVQALPVVLCRSINVLEETADGFIVRELKLEPVKGE